MISHVVCSRAVLLSTLAPYRVSSVDGISEPDGPADSELLVKDSRCQRTRVQQYAIHLHPLL